MSAEAVHCFLDTNVLVYAMSSSPEERDKKETAIHLVETADFGLSAQVLQELYVTLTRKVRARVPPD